MKQVNADALRAVAAEARQAHTGAWLQASEALEPGILKSARLGKTEHKTPLFWDYHTAPGQLDFIQDWLHVRGFRTSLEASYGGRGGVIGHYIIISWGL